MYHLPFDTLVNYLLLSIQSPFRLLNGVSMRFNYTWGYYLFTTDTFHLLFS